MRPSTVAFRAEHQRGTPTYYVSHRLVSLRHFCLAVSLVTLGAACSASSTTASFAIDPASVTLRFADEDPLAIAPLSTTRIEVIANQRVTVRFALLGDPRDASLSASQVDTIEGSAAVFLHAPSTSGPFTLRASVEDGPSVERVIEVSGNPPVAKLQVSANYLGSRDVSSWTVAPFAGARCQDLAPDALDPDISVSGAAFPIEVAVPVEDPVAVVVHADGRVRGCSSVSALKASEVRVINVTVADTKADARAFPLTLSLSVDGTPGLWPELVDNWRQRYVDAALGASPNDAAFVLDAIALQLTPTQLAAFDSARATWAWDTFLTAFYALASPSAAFDAWVSGAAMAIETTPGSIFGQMSFDGTADGQCLLKVAKWFDEPTMTSATLSWSIDDGDTVFLGGNISFAASRILEPKVFQSAIETLPGASSTSDALDAYVQCDAIAQGLAQVSGDVFDGCSSACFASLCHASVESIVARAAAIDDDPARYSVVKLSTSGAASLDPHARVVGFSGSWLGGLVDPNASIAEVDLSGSATAIRLP